MVIFYTNEIEGNKAVLSEEESKHCVQVLRRDVGDKVAFIDGVGGYYKGEIIEAAKKRVVIAIEERFMQYGKRNFRVHIAIAPTKSMDRMEWFVEKATEIGVDEITPITCFHSERRRLRIDRLEKVALAASKQSVKAYLPTINPMISFEQFIDNWRNKRETVGTYIAYLGDEVLHSLMNSIDDKEEIIVLIGPEGDFSLMEIEQALEAGFQGVNLGPSRLRTETAGVVACHITNIAKL